MRKLLTLAFAIALAMPAAAEELPITALKDLPSGRYHRDPAHSSLTFKVRHMGMSNYTARFVIFDATIDYNQQKPLETVVTASVNPESIRTDFPDPTKVNFDRELAGKDWLDAAQYPAMTFKSTKLTSTGPNTGTMTGDLTLHGVTKPVTLAVTYIGGMSSHPMSKQPAMGFSSTGTIKRSDFGMTKGAPFVGDDVQIIIEAEFQKDL